MSKKNLIFKAKRSGFTNITFSEAYDPYRDSITYILISLPSTARTKTIAAALILISKYYPDLNI